MNRKTIIALFCACILAGCTSAQQTAIDAADATALSNTAAIKATDSAFKAGAITEAQANAALNGEAIIAQGVDATVRALTTQPTTQP